jgi:hypothetical protein
MFFGGRYSGSQEGLPYDVVDAMMVRLSAGNASAGVSMSAVRIDLSARRTLVSLTQRAA